MSDIIEQFAALHVPGSPLILYNIWDAGSAVAVAAAGAKAIATGSYGVAEANGLKDGETVPVDLALANARRIVGAIDLPVTLDFETGYGTTPADVGRSVVMAAQTGIVGINMEDKKAGTREMVDSAEQAARLRAAADTGLFVNARCDLFIVNPPQSHDETLADAALERARAYADAGARGIFFPFVRDPRLIARLCEGSPLPVNILIGEGVPGHKELASLGVARISHGHGPWAAAMATLRREAEAVFGLF
jgi:2-methylisocitrate lyase-like PEP mutase family enzyme